MYEMKSSAARRCGSEETSKDVNGAVKREASSGSTGDDFFATGYEVNENKRRR